MRAKHLVLFDTVRLARAHLSDTSLPGGACGGLFTLLRELRRAAFKQARTALQSPEVIQPPSACAALQSADSKVLGDISEKYDRLAHLPHGLGVLSSDACKIRVLDVSGNHAGAAAAEQLAKAVQFMPLLEELFFHHNRVPLADLQPLAAKLAGSKRLKVRHGIS